MLAAINQPLAFFQGVEKIPNVTLLLLSRSARHLVRFDAYHLAFGVRRRFFALLTSLHFKAV